MIYGVVDARGHSVPVTQAKVISVAIPQQSISVTTLKTVIINKDISLIHSPQTLSVAETPAFHTTTAKAITVAMPQSLQSTAINIGAIPPIGAGGFRASARILQPGNLQADKMRVNWQHPLAGGLVYLEVFNALHFNPNDYPLMPAFIGNHGTLTRDSAAQMSIRSGPGGYGYSSAANNTSMRANGGNLVRVPQSKGSYFAYVTADFNAGDSVSHYITVIGRETAGTEQYFCLFKFSDNKIYFGWMTNGVSYRATPTSTGLWSAGDSFMIGGTWNSSDVNCFVKGKLAGSLGSAPTPGNTTTATAVYRFGNSNTTGNAWGTLINKNYIYYFAMWDRDLSADECNYLNQNPWCFMKPIASRP